MFIFLKFKPETQKTKETLTFKEDNPIQRPRSMPFIGCISMISRKKAIGIDIVSINSKSDSFFLTISFLN